MHEKSVGVHGKSATKNAGETNTLILYLNKQQKLLVKGKSPRFTFFLSYTRRCQIFFSISFIWPSIVFLHVKRFLKLNQFGIN